MKEWHYTPAPTLLQKITAVCVGAWLGLLLAVIQIVFWEFLDEWRFMSLPVFVAGAVIILGLAYLPRF
jgi:hypothetical protein